MGVEIAINEQNFKGIKKEIEIVKNDPRLSFVALLEEDTVWTGVPGKFIIHDTVLTSFPENVSIPHEISSNGLLIVKRASLNTKLMNGNGAIELGFKTAEISKIKDQLRKVSFIASGVVLHDCNPCGVLAGQEYFEAHTFPAGSGPSCR